MAETQQHSIYQAKKNSPIGGSPTTFEMAGGKRWRTVLFYRYGSNTNRVDWSNLFAAVIW